MFASRLKKCSYGSKTDQYFKHKSTNYICLWYFVTRFWKKGRKAAIYLEVADIEQAVCTQATNTLRKEFWSVTVSENWPH